jgi:hypothetical protein
MKHIIMLAGAAALSFAGPAFAKPGQGHGHGNGYGHAKGFDDQGDDEDEGLGGQRFGYGAGGCPPGLAKKTPACVPPGQARKQQQVALGQNVYAQVPYGYANPYAVNQVPYGYANPYAMGQVPYGYANPYAASPYGAYAAPGYANPYGYGYNPQAQMVQQIIGSLIR